MVKRLACTVTLGLVGCPSPSAAPPAPPNASSSRAAGPVVSHSAPAPAPPSAVKLAVSGTLTKASDGKSLPFVVIRFDDLGLVTNADAYGAFSLRDVPIGSHRVTLSGGPISKPVSQTWSIAPDQTPLQVALTNRELGAETVIGGGGGGGGGGGTPAPTPTGSTATPMPTGTATPPPTTGSYNWTSKIGGDSTAPQSGSYQSDFQATPIGQESSDFIDVIQDLNGKPAWLYPGSWSVQAVTGGILAGLVYNQSQTAAQPYFSMRRYRGSAFGTPDGAVPNHYQVTVKLQPLQSPYLKAPVGETALLAYYHDPGNYVKLVVQQASIDVWAANDAIPGDNGGWAHYFSFPFPSEAGSVQTVGAVINASTGTLIPQINGQSYEPIQIGKITAKRHYVGLCAAGNSFNAKDLSIQSK